MTLTFVATTTFAGCIASGDPSLDPAIDPVTGEHAGELGRSAAGVVGPGSTPAPVASLTLASGHVIEFYDFGGSALIAEAGAAYTPPALNSAGAVPADQLSALWRRLAPETPVPPALADLQQRLTDASSSASSSSGVSKVAPPADTGGEPITVPRTALPAAPQGCNNGCCDETWLRTIVECQDANWNWAWFLYNYGWTFANSTHVEVLQAMACSAQGTSTFSLNIGGSGGVWNVPEATYRWFHWTAPTDWLGGPLPSNLSSTVNSSTNLHLHTYCGRVKF